MCMRAAFVHYPVSQPSLYNGWSVAGNLFHQPPRRHVSRCMQTQKLGHQQAQPQMGSSLDILDQQIGQNQEQNKLELAIRYHFRQIGRQLAPK